MTLPRAPFRLSDDLARAIGHTVSGFGYLEEALKRAIHSLTRKGLGKDADDRAMAKWLQRMEDIADDSLGTLIDAFDAALRQSQIRDRKDLMGDLRRIKHHRNLLCHASWRPTDQPGRWHPLFLNTRGERYPEDMSADDILDIHDRTLDAIAQIVAIMRSTGIDGEWAGTDSGD